MRDDLYYIPLIAIAWQRQDMKPALVSAFVEIRRRGQQARYERGYRQFRQWIQAVATYREHLVAQGGVMNPRASGAQRFPVNVSLFREEQLIAKLALTRGGEPVAVDYIRPGRYRLVLETGRVVWVQRLPEAALFPEPHIPMAADDGRESSQPVRTFRVPDAGLAIQLSLRLGSGQFVISLLSKETLP